MRSFLYPFLLSLVLMAAPSVFAADDVEVSLSVDGTIDIDPEGAVVDYSLNTPVAEGLRAAIDSRVRRWRFDPILVDGVAVSARTSMVFAIRADKVADERYQLHFGKPTFGAPSLVRGSQVGRGAVQYPREMLQFGVGGRVMLAIRIDETGRVVDAHPYQTSLDARPRTERQAKKLREAMERAIMRSVRHWRFEPGESIDGETRAVTAFIPVDFAVFRPGQATPKNVGWRAMLPGPVSPAPWHEQVPVDIDLDALENGVAASLDSSFRLRASSEEG